MNKFLSIVFFVCLFACSQKKASDDIRDIFVRNNISGYEILETRYSRDNHGSVPTIINKTTLDRNGNILTVTKVQVGETMDYIYTDSLLNEIKSTAKDGSLIYKATIAYRNNQKIYTYRNANDTLYKTETYYTNFAGKDTLQTCYSAQGELLWKVTIRYDEVGIKEETKAWAEDTTSCVRINDDKYIQIFETKNYEGKLLSRITDVYNDNRQLIDVVREEFLSAEMSVYTHYKTSYLENGLIDTVTYLDAENQIVKIEKYSYTNF